MFTVSLIVCSFKHKYLQSPYNISIILIVNKNIISRKRSADKSPFFPDHLAGRHHQVLICLFVCTISLALLCFSSYFTAFQAKHIRVECVWSKSEYSRLDYLLRMEN